LIHTVAKNQQKEDLYHSMFYDI